MKYFFGCVLTLALLRSGLAALPTPSPAPTINLMQGITYKSCTVSGNFIALTFDDGPHPVNSPKLLDILKQHHAKATFFVMGSNSSKYPELLKRMVAEGHEVGNHTWSHPHLGAMEFPAVRSELDRTSDAIASALGKRPTLFRPPFMDTSPTMEKWINKETGMKTIEASVDSGDWRDHDSALARQHILEGVTPGAIILAHETQPTTVQALPGILDELQAKGYKLVTVSELIAMDRSGH